MQPPTRKRSYLLLEVVCCLALVALCLWPLLKPTVGLYICKQQMLSKIYDYKLEKEALGRIKEMLYSHDFPFKQLQQGLCFPLDLDKTTCFVHLQETKHVAKPSLHRIGLLLQVDLEFKKVNGSQLTSSHLVFIEGITP